ncbi:MAG: hypothetical protein DRP79_04590 [Planctomycetota bacterium]|nr:MAG: hypothetical protein DRP79_04590 [Planctomycetota bacterium]
MFNLEKVLLVVIIMSMVSLSASALMIEADGDLSDWSVAPFSDWEPASPSAGWIEENWTGEDPYPWGGETYDVEALYVDTDTEYLYVAVVLSIPEAGADDPYGRPEHYLPGDIALDFDGDPDTGEYGYEYGLKAYGDDKGELYWMPDWDLPHGEFGFPENSPSTILSGTLEGAGTVAYVNAGDLEGNGTDTFIIEAKVLRSLFAHGPLLNGQTISAHYTISCGNDVLETSTLAIPEPVTIIMVGLGLTVVAGLARRFVGASRGA